MLRSRSLPRLLRPWTAPAADIPAERSENPRGAPTPLSARRRTPAVEHRDEPRGAPAPLSARRRRRRRALPAPPAARRWPHALSAEGAPGDDDDDDDLECSICLEPFREPVRAPCAHVFCRACASALPRSAGCPLCRAPFRTPFGAPWEARDAPLDGRTAARFRAARALEPPSGHLFLGARGPAPPLSPRSAAVARAKARAGWRCLVVASAVPKLPHAPVEVGVRVWRDDAALGRGDATERLVASLVVKRYVAARTTLPTVSTARAPFAFELGGGEWAGLARDPRPLVVVVHWRPALGQPPLWVTHALAEEAVEQEVWVKFDTRRLEILGDG